MLPYRGAQCIELLSWLIEGQESRNFKSEQINVIILMYARFRARISESLRRYP